MIYLIFIAICAIAVIVLIAMAAMAGSKRTKPAIINREPWEVLRDSILTNFDQWQFLNRSSENQDYSLWWQVSHKETKTGIYVFRGGRSTSYPNSVGFFGDSKVKFLLSSDQQEALYKALKTALAKKLERKMAPRQVNYKDGLFYCPYCGEKVDASIVREEDAELGEDYGECHKES